MAEPISPGKWSDGAERLLPRGEGVWSGIPRRGYVYQIGRKVVATIRNKQNGNWITKIPGWEFLVTPDMPSARFQKIAGDKFTHTPVKAFRSSAEARRQIEAIYASLPAPVGADIPHSPTCSYIFSSGAKSCDCR